MLRDYLCSVVLVGGLAEVQQHQEKALTCRRAAGPPPSLPPVGSNLSPSLRSTQVGKGAFALLTFVRWILEGSGTVRTLINRNSGLERWLRG